MLTARTTLRLVQHHLFGLDNPWALRCYTWSSTDGTGGPISWMDAAVKYGTSINIAFHQHHATVSTGAQIATADSGRFFGTPTACTRATSRCGDTQPMV